jgi:FtsP/CotA-like multicopper oxidase with cupredoxin domain
MEGTYFYHSHMAMQEMMGMIGAFIMHPKEPYKPSADKDFAITMQEYAILPNIKVPNSMNMEFNWLTFNGKSGPANTPLIVRHGERVRIRLINLGRDHHPIHLHGHQFVITGTEGGHGGHVFGSQQTLASPWPCPPTYDQWVVAWNLNSLRDIECAAHSIGVVRRMVLPLYVGYS